MNPVVIRLSSLGDVVLTGSITKHLTTVTLVTLPQYKTIANKILGVERVLTPQDALPKKASLIVDLQNNWTSKKIRRTIQGPTRIIHKPRWRHWQRIWFKRSIPMSTVPERYARAANCSVSAKPWIARTSTGTALALIPGARHPTKRWPLEYYANIASRWPEDVYLLGSLPELDLLRDIQHRCSKRINVIAENGFEQTIQALSTSSVALGNDTGILHLAAAMSIPVVALFGPTTSTDGFWCHEGEAVELPMFCRPCSRFGGATCPIGDQACLTNLTPDMVWRKLSRFIS